MYLEREINWINLRLTSFFYDFLVVDIDFLFDVVVVRLEVLVFASRTEWGERHIEGHITSCTHENRRQNKNAKETISTKVHG